MPLRPFRCPACDHHLRLGCTHCGRCAEPAPVYNRKATVVAGVLALLILFALLLL